jgi:aminodeoxyfutalosine deaminase
MLWLARKRQSCLATSAAQSVKPPGRLGPSLPEFISVHLEGTVRAGTLLRIARRNSVPLPADSVEGLAGLYEFGDFAHFLQVWLLTTGALRTGRDFR